MTGEHKDIKVTLIRTLDLKESAQGRIKLEGGSFLKAVVQIFLKVGWLQPPC